MSTGRLRSRATAFVLREYDISYTDLVSKRRRGELVAARALFAWIAKTFGPYWLSYETIGSWLGGRDHSTIIHEYRKIAPRLRARDPEFLRLCDKFVAEAAADLETIPCT